MFNIGFLHEIRQTTWVNKKYKRRMLNEPQIIQLNITNIKNNHFLWRGTLFLMLVMLRKNIFHTFINLYIPVLRNWIVFIWKLPPLASEIFSICLRIEKKNEYAPARGMFYIPINAYFFIIIVFLKQYVALWCIKHTRFQYFLLNIFHVF